MKKLILLLVLFCTMSMTGQNVLTIDRTETKQTFILNGVSQGGDLVASEVDENTVRLRGEGRSADYKTKSGFTDFLIAGVNPTDVDNAVELINDITKKRTFDVVLQDSTSPLVSVHALELTGQTTLTQLSVQGEFTFNVDDTAGAVVDQNMTVYSVISERISFFHILSINVNEITVDSAIDFAYNTGDFVSFGNENLAVDGSVTPVVFGVRNSTNGGQNQDISLTVDLTRMILSMELTSFGSLDEFGNIPSLTNGLLVRFVNGIHVNLFNIKNNREFLTLMYDFNLISASGNSPDGLAGRFTFSELGAVIRLKPFEDLQFVVQDDLTDLTIFEIIVQGAGVID